MSSTTIRATEAVFFDGWGCVVLKGTTATRRSSRVRRQKDDEASLKHLGLDKAAEITKDDSARFGLERKGRGISLSKAKGQ
jgi:hypothetical protein